MRTLLFALLALLPILSPVQAQSGGRPKEVAVGSDLRKELFDLLRPRIARIAKKKVKFEGSLKRLGDWAFFTGRTLDERGNEVRMGDGESTDTAALWQNTDDGWELVEYSGGHTDVVYLEWPEKHGAPKALIGE